MARGMVSGLIWGAVASVVGLGAVSVAMDPPELGGAQDDPAGAEAPARVPEAAADPAPAPAIANETPPGQQPGVTDAPVTEGAAPVQPVAPRADDAGPTPAPVPSESPDAPAMAGTPPEENAPAMGAAVDTAPAPDPVTEAPGQPSAGEIAQSSGVSVSGDTPVDAPDDGATAVEAPTTDPDPQVETAVSAAQPEKDDPEPATEEGDQTQTATAAPDPSPDPSPDPETSAETDTGPSIGQGASDLDQLAPEVKTGRLPRLGDAETGAASGDSAEAGPRPIEAYAVPVEVAEGASMMSIILIDDGSGGFGSEALAAFPYPLSFAVNANSTQAAERAADYRARGFEVLAMGNLPDGATPQDAEVALAAYLNAVPEAVAVMETPDAGLQKDRATTTQIARSLSASGHGLLLFPKGLNTAAAIAEKEGVPVASIFRDLDGQGQSPGQIRRLLDQAALRADQGNAVILTARLRPDTISALLLWGLQDRTGRLALVPASRALTETPG